MHLTRNVSESGFVIKDFKNPEELPHTDPPDRYHLMSFASSSRSSADTRPESQTSQKFGPEMKKNQLSIVSKTNHPHYFIPIGLSWISHLRSQYTNYWIHV